MKKLYAIALAATLALTGCTSATQPTTVRLAAHDSFVISDELINQFEQESGLDLEIIRLGDTGALTNQLVLTKNAPIADAFFGIDNTFLGQALENGIVEGEVSEIDYSDVCFNYDIGWFEKNNIQPPASWRDLGAEEYRGLTVIPNPRFSSPGLAFLATTHEGFETSAEVFAYWRSVRDNDVKIAGSWEDAYFSDFTRYGGNRPIVLSYASSPSAEVAESGQAGTAALLDECFRQVEYAGVIAKSANARGAQQLVEFLRSPSFQSSVPEAMYVYPSVVGTEIPQSWVDYAKPATSTVGEDLDIAANRDKWLTDWSDVFDN
jgi:thiamine transport system substrate-binding protein